MHPFDAVFPEADARDVFDVHPCLLPVMPHRLRPAARPGLAVTRLGPGRWCIVATQPGDEPNLAVYLSPAEGNAIRAVQLAGRYDLRIEGMLGEAGVANLGDCLVGALERGVRCIGVALVEPDQEQPLAAEGLLESLGRVSARQGGWPEVAVSGEGVGVLALSRAFARGLKQEHLGRLRPGGR